ncbi:MAG: MBL fold metallo-hydrolase [Candidatus Thorarchaeota archaeon]|nr:MAG: MBL fold metallo-hydrolase [Candidatus Thorarchaeota archaeon]
MAITIRCLAHASFQIKTETQNIYIDPSTQHTDLKEKDFEPADLILVTHPHQDHFDKKLLKKIRKLGSPIIAPPSVREQMKGGVVWDVGPGQFMQLSSGIDVRAVDAYNIKRFRPNGEPFHPKGQGVGYILKIEGKRIYHAGDTDLIPEMEGLFNIDVALLPSGDTYTMDIAEASEAATMINPEVAIPMHLKGSDPEVFKNNVEGKSSTKVVILGEGEEYTLE